MAQTPVQKNQVGIDIPFKKNAIINGDFNIWQRGTTITTVALGEYTADRYQYSKVGAMIHTASRSSDVPTVAQANKLFNFSHQLALTTPDTSLAANDYTWIGQQVEGFNFLSFAQRPMILSFWVKSSLTGTYCVAFTNSINDRSFVSEYIINVANTWEYKTITILASPSAGTWNYTTGRGLLVAFTLAAGTTFQTATPNVWLTGNFIATTNQINGVNTGAGNFLITGVQLESGSIVTPFEARPFNEELALCQRYYTKTYDIDVVPGTITGIAGNGVILETSSGTAVGSASHIWYFPVAMRLAPTVVIFNPTTGAIGTSRSAPSDNANRASDGNRAGQRSVHLANNVLITDEVNHYYHATADAEL